MTLLAVAHRAGNSPAATRAAMVLGVDVIEADVHAHRGRLEVRHLKTMGPLPWLWDRWELQPASLPRLALSELLAAAQEHAVFMLDLKGRRGEVGEHVARQLHAHAPNRQVIVCSRYWPALRPFEAVPWVRTVMSARNRGELALLIRRLPAGPPRYGVSVHRSLLSPEVVGALHHHVEVVLTWPVNDPRALAQVARWQGSGAVGVISDDLAVLRQVLRARPQPPGGPASQ